MSRRWPSMRIDCGRVIGMPIVKQPLCPSPAKVEHPANLQLLQRQRRQARDRSTIRWTSVRWERNGRRRQQSSRRIRRNRETPVATYVVPPWLRPPQERNCRPAFRWAAIRIVAVRTGATALCPVESAYCRVAGGSAAGAEPALGGVALRCACDDPSKDSSIRCRVGTATARRSSEPAAVPAPVAPHCR